MENIDENIPVQPDESGSAGNTSLVPPEENRSLNAADAAPSSQDEEIEIEIEGGEQEIDWSDSPMVAGTAQPEGPVYYDEDARSSPYVNNPYTDNVRTKKAPKPRRKKKPMSEGSRKFLRTVISLVLVAGMVAGGCVITAANLNRSWAIRTAELVSSMKALENAVEKNSTNSGSSGSHAQARPSGTQSVSGELLTPAEVYAQNVDCVVAVHSLVYSSTGAQGTSSGSGFIISEDGYVVTNYHVVESSSGVTVIMHNGDSYEAKVVGYDAPNDVAVLKVNATGLPAVILGSSEDLAVGDMVVAIGNPLGSLTATQTVGYVSGKNREITTDSSIINMIQTDAAINSGNSGGPLLNMYGEVVGITSAKYSGTSSSGASIEGISFAIPIDDVMGIIGDLQNYGYVTGAYLGVTVQNTDAASAELYGLPTGAYVATTVEGAAADRAGVRPKDIIIKLGDYDVHTVTDLTRALRHFKANDTTTITVIRSGQIIELSITLDEKPRDSSSSNQGTPQMPQEGNYDEWYEYFRRYFGNGQG